MNRRQFLKTTGTGLAGASVASVASVAGSGDVAAKAKPLNILYIFADQMHGFAMGCMRNPDARTPNLDRLAKEGVLFRNAYSNAPVSGPYRGTLMTGTYISQNRVYGNGRSLPKGAPTIATSLNEGGYRTSYVGKWHLGGAGNRPIPPELRGGFRDFIGYQCYNDFLDGVWFFDEDGKKDARSIHRTEATTDIAIERLRRAAGGRFALFVSYQNPHYPEQPSPKYEAMYRGRKMHRRPNCRDIDPYTGTHSPPRKGPADPAFRRYSKNLEEYLRLYYAMVAQLDDNVGRLMAELDRLGLAENTVVMFSSDHGDMQGSHGKKNKCSPYEESSRIPFLVRVPGGRKGYVADDPVSGIDVYPSCLSYARLPKEPTNEGADLAPLTLGPARDLGGRPVFPELGNWAMIREGCHKLVVKRPSKSRKDRKSRAAGKITPTHLFDLKRDPYEMRNLVRESASGGVRSRLLDEITEWHARVTGA